MFAASLFEQQLTSPLLSIVGVLWVISFITAISVDAIFFGFKRTHGRSGGYEYLKNGSWPGWLAVKTYAQTTYIVMTALAVIILIIGR